MSDTTPPDDQAITRHTAMQSALAAADGAALAGPGSAALTPHRLSGTPAR
jgi:hypothetical protein